VLVLVALAIVVDWFAVPDLEGTGKDCSWRYLKNTQCDPSLHGS